MSTSFIPPVLTSLIFGMIISKFYLKEEKKIERYVSMPQSTKVQYNTESGGYNPRKAAAEFYNVVEAPSKGMPSTVDIPLPTPSDGEDLPPKFVVDRVSDYPATRHRLNENADRIRGDLDIPTKKICSMFNYVTINDRVKVDGILDFGTGVRNPDQENYLEYEKKTV